MAESILSSEDLEQLRSTIPAFDADPIYPYLAEKKALFEQHGLEGDEGAGMITRLRRGIFGYTRQEKGLIKRQQEALVPFRQEQEIKSKLEALRSAGPTHEEVFNAGLAPETRIPTVQPMAPEYSTMTLPRYGEGVPPSRMIPSLQPTALSGMLSSQDAGVSGWRSEPIQADIPARMEQPPTNLVVPSEGVTPSGPIVPATPSVKLNPAEFDLYHSAMKQREHVKTSAKTHTTDAELRAMLIDLKAQEKAGTLPKELIPQLKAAEEVMLDMKRLPTDDPRAQNMRDTLKHKWAVLGMQGELNSHKMALMDARRALLEMEKKGTTPDQQLRLRQVEAMERKLDFTLDFVTRSALKGELSTEALEMLDRDMAELARMLEPVLKKDSPLWDRFRKYLSPVLPESVVPAPATPGRVPRPGEAPTQQAPSATPKLPKPTTPEEAEKLAPGTKYLTPDGKTMVR